MKKNTLHWWMLRAASLPLVPLFFYFITQLPSLTTRSRMEFISWVKKPVASAALIIFIICSFYHACLGMDEIIEDYISADNTKKLARVANKIFFLGLGAACLYAVMRIYNGHF